jgi:hypothetical protein
VTSFNTGTTATVTNSGTASGTFTIPAGVLSGDIIYVLVMAFTTASGALTDTLTSTATTPVLVGSQQSTGVNSGIQVTSGIWQIVATGSDAGATLTFGTSGGSGGTYWYNVGLGAWTGFSSVNPDVNAGTEFFSASSTGTTTTPSATTGTAGDWQIQFLGVAPPNGNNFTVPGGLTGREAITSATNQGLLLQIADSNGSVGGSGTSIGNTTWTIPANASNTWSTSFTVGITPAVSGGPPPQPQPGSRTWRARFRRGQVPWPTPATVPAPPAQPPALLKGAPAAVKGRLTGVAAPPAAAPPGSGPAVLPQPGSRSWRARFRRRQAPSAPLGLAPSVPSPFFAPHTLLQGPAAAGRSELFHVEAPPPVRPGPPAPFHPPHLLLQGPAARVLARLTGARGRPGVPAPFTPPRVPLRGPAAAVKGRLTGVAAPPPVRHLILGGFPLRGPAAAAKGTLSGVAAPPPVLHPVVVSTFKAPGFPLRGPAAARKGGVTGLAAPPPVTQPNVPAPFYAPHVLLRGPVPAVPGTKTTGAVAPPPAPPPLAPPHWQGSTHMIAATATGNLIQGANHTGRGGPGPDLKGDYERSGD